MFSCRKLKKLLITPSVLREYPYEEEEHPTRAGLPEEFKEFLETMVDWIIIIQSR